MQWHHPFPAQVGKTRLETRLQLRCEVDFRHHHQHLRVRVLRQHPAGGAQVNLGLAATGGAEQQRRPLASQTFNIKFGNSACLLRAKCYQFSSFLRAGGVRHRPLQPARELQGGQVAQLRRQGGKRDLAQRPLVIRGSKSHQFAPIGRKGRQPVQNASNIANLPICRLAADIGRNPDHAEHFTPAERNAHQRAGRQRRIAAVGKRSGEPTVCGRGDHDLQPMGHENTKNFLVTAVLHALSALSR